jgi:hypothetical protein
VLLLLLLLLLLVLLLPLVGGRSRPGLFQESSAQVPGSCCRGRQLTYSWLPVLLLLLLLPVGGRG